MDIEYPGRSFDVTLYGQKLGSISVLVPALPERLRRIVRQTRYHGLAARDRNIGGWGEIFQLR